MTEAAAERCFLVLPHTGREDSKRAAVTTIASLKAAGAVPVLAAGDLADLRETDPIVESCAVLGKDVPLERVELAIVLGGDGTILRAAETVRATHVPIIGVNLGHVGFLAEVEREDLDSVVHRAIDRDYEVEERMTLSVRVKLDGEVIYETWALNEASVEKGSRERSLEVAIEVDGLPLSTFGCDGIVISTPTGSTAYSFSAGGPVVWPSVEALLMVPLSAHALFARPLVVGPESSLAVEVLDRSVGAGVLWCDGRRTFDLPHGARVVARRAADPVRLARLSPGPFTERLVNKFRLPVAGWRGPVGEEIRP